MATNKSKQVQQNTPGWTTPPPTHDVSELRSMVDKAPDYSVPIRNQYARAQQRNANSYKNPLGAFTTADVQDKTMRATNMDLDQSMGMDLAAAAQQTAADKFNRQATVAGMTNPRMYMANSTNSSPFTGGDILQMGLSGASAFLT